ncbi:MAG: hypothetical protein ABSA57_10840, partial [Candidatus Acidiferrales bacterium]
DKRGCQYTKYNANLLGDSKGVKQQQNQLVRPLRKARCGIVVVSMVSMVSSIARARHAVRNRVRESSCKGSFIFNELSCIPFCPRVSREVRSIRGRVSPGWKTDLSGAPGERLSMAAVAAHARRCDPRAFAVRHRHQATYHCPS